MNNIPKIPQNVQNGLWIILSIAILYLIFKKSIQKFFVKTQLANLPTPESANTDYKGRIRELKDKFVEAFDNHSWTDYFSSDTDAEYILAVLAAADNNTLVMVNNLYNTENARKSGKSFRKTISDASYFLIGNSKNKTKILERLSSLNINV